MGRPAKPVTTNSKIATVMRAMGKAASTDETRYNMRGVYVETDTDTGAVTMTATDGHWLATVELPRATVTTEGPDGPLAWTVPNGLYDAKDASAQIELGLNPVAIDIGEMGYPNWRQVVPLLGDKGERARVWCLNAEYVAEAMDVLARIAKVFGTTKAGVPVKFRAPKDEISPAMMELKTADFYVRVVIMPMRV